MAGVDRPWLYSAHPDYPQFMRLVAVYLQREYTAITALERANEVMDALDSVRAVGGVDRDDPQTPPRQPRVQPVEGGLPPHHDNPFLSLPDGTLFYRGPMDNLVISQPLNNCEITIQRADVSDMLHGIDQKFFIRK